MGQWTSSTSEGEKTYTLFRTAKGRFAVHHARSEMHSPVGPGAMHSRNWSAGRRGWIGDWSPGQA
ncbi:hypothetical protein Aab01nite_62380 [Paractinoplanes abujensis]|uniref:Uncharacterized protein n=1 Tax=Paractinoplanes abujensis TaxID=882441 RepID=A0A7W7CQH4_9ACTN|nr:hypothetical protein [Actinoplanes abujensis]MBB4692852.1 hypothetical protein [Actinoplanes abujensis]GID22648.1 hypothetical protein Aab01nite_62380 [Actinoplanes abujensis]